MGGGGVGGRGVALLILSHFHEIFKNWERGLPSLDPPLHKLNSCTIHVMGSKVSPICHPILCITMSHNF